MLKGILTALPSNIILPGNYMPVLNIAGVALILRPDIRPIQAPMV
jgi:hypothetical protein